MVHGFTEERFGRMLSDPVHCPYMLCKKAMATCEFILLSLPCLVGWVHLFVRAPLFLGTLTLQRHRHPLMQSHGKILNNKILSFASNAFVSNFMVFVLPV